MKPIQLKDVSTNLSIVKELVPLLEHFLDKEEDKQMHEPYDSIHSIIYALKANLTSMENTLTKRQDNFL
jgi:hypothetical protein